MHTLILMVMLSSPTYHTEYQTIGIIGRGIEGDLIFGKLYPSRDACEAHAMFVARSWRSTMAGNGFPFLVGCREVVAFGLKQKPHR